MADVLGMFPNNGFESMKGVSRKKAFRPSAPVTDHIKECLAFLHRVSSVEIIGGDKKQFEIAVKLLTTKGDETSYTITRSAEDIATLQRVAVDVCGQHYDLSAYNIAKCALCEQFSLELLPKLPTKTLGRMVYSEQQIHHIFQTRLQGFVIGSIVPPTNPELFCEGFERMPSAVTKFLLRGVDQSLL